MELSVIWYIAAIAANVAVIILAVYIGILVTAYYIERWIARREQKRRERIPNWTRRGIGKR